MQHLKSNFTVSIFPTTELKTNANFIALIEELLSASKLDVVVVCIRTDAELNLLDLIDGFRRLLFQLCLFVFVFSVVANTAHWRASVWCNLHKIHTDGFRLFHGFTRTHYSELLIFIYNTHFGCTDTFVDTCHVTTWTEWFFLRLSYGVLLWLVRNFSMGWQHRNDTCRDSRHWNVW